MTQPGELSMKFHAIGDSSPLNTSTFLKQEGLQLAEATFRDKTQENENFLEHPPQGQGFPMERGET